MNTEQERAEFEAFASKHGLCVTEGGDLYRSHVVAWMWKAWQARAALQSQDREDAERYRTVFDLLKILFEAWENGPACYNNGDRDEYIGNAFLLDDKTFHACVKALSIDHARRVEGEGE